MNEGEVPVNKSVIKELMNSGMPVRLKNFLILRAVTCLGSLSALLFFFIMGYPVVILSFFAILIIFWYLGSFLVETFAVAVGRTLKLRCGLFAIVDVYLLHALFLHVGGTMIPAVSAFLGYILLATSACGVFVGLLTWFAGVTAFVYGYVMNTDIGFGALVFTATAAALAILLAVVWRRMLSRFASLMPGRLGAELAASEEALSAARKEVDELRATMTKMEEQLVKITKERDESLALIDQLKAKTGEADEQKADDTEPSDTIEEKEEPANPEQSGPEKQETPEEPAQEQSEPEKPKTSEGPETEPPAPEKETDR